MSSAPFGWLPAYDDAYITLASAQAIWTGSVPAYPGAPPLVGVTSPLHTLLVAALLPFVQPESALFFSQLVGAVLYAVGLWWLISGFEPEREVRVVWMVVGLATGMVPEHLFNGLETGLALAAGAWLLALLARRHAAAWIVAGLVPFVRPDLALLSAGATAWWTFRVGRPGRAELGLLAAAALPLSALELLRSGSLLPWTSHVKQAFLAEECWPLPLRLSIGFVALSRWLYNLGPLALGFLGAARAGIARWMLVSFAAAWCAYSLLLPSHLNGYHHRRYLWVWLPVVMLGALARCSLLLSRRARGSAALLVALVALLRAPGFFADRLEWIVAFHGEQHALVDWLGRNVPVDERLLVVDAGYLAHATAYELVDVVGLKTPASRRAHERWTSPSCGADRAVAIAEIASTAEIRYFVSWAEWEERLHFTDELARRGWGVEPLRRRPRTAEGGWWYPVFRLTPPVSGGG